MKLAAISCALSCASAFAQAPLPAMDLHNLVNIMVRDFESIDRIQTVGMSDDPLGRFDVIVVGDRKTGGWRVEVLSVDHHKVTVKWDSTDIAKEPQYSNSGPKSISVDAREYDYDLMIEGCAPHLCHDGVSGFLVFQAKIRKIFQAKVVTQGLDNANIRNPKYDVTFTGEDDQAPRGLLEKMMCRSPAISNKRGLPFSCQTR